MASRSPRHSRDLIPLSAPERTIALWLVRCSDDPCAPLRIALDYTLLDQLGWGPGDRITFEPIALDRCTREGGLVVRRIAPGEPGIVLESAHYERRRHPYADLYPGRPLPDHLQFGPDGPDVEWPCSPEWIETFFPLEYIPGPGSPIFIEPDRRWLLRDLLDQRERVVVSLGCSLLEFRLQRTDPDAPTLDVHLPPGVLHLMDWSPATPLALISASGFDPSASDDTLSIRRACPGKPKLTWDGSKFISSPDPVWLDRYFPGQHDNTAEIPPQHPHEMPSDPDPDHNDFDVVKFSGQSPHKREFSLADQGRDTFCVHYRDFQLGQDSLSFAIPKTSEFWE